MRKEILANGEYYHVYNRGVDKRLIFQDDFDLGRFLLSLREFNSVETIGSIYENSFRKNEKHQLGNPVSKLVEIVCYCLNPNHYHLILKQITDQGVSKFIKSVAGGYTKYFNEKYKRKGVLFQGSFRASHIDSNEYLLRASAYVSLNNRFKTFIPKLSRSSWGEYMKKGNTLICTTEIILDQFKSLGEYESFALEALEDIKNNKLLQKELSDFIS